MWPVRSAEGWTALEKLLEKGEYVFNPLNACNSAGVTISPAHWERDLKGADILIETTLLYHFIGKGDTRKDNFYADISSIRVLRPPRAILNPRDLKHLHNKLLPLHSSIDTSSSQTQSSSSATKRPIDEPKASAQPLTKRVERDVTKESDAEKTVDSFTEKVAGKGRDKGKGKV